jgi:hypothetical protein
MIFRAVKNQLAFYSTTQTGALHSESSQNGTATVRCNVHNLELEPGQFQLQLQSPNVPDAHTVPPEQMRWDAGIDRIRQMRAQVIRSHLRMENLWLQIVSNQVEHD